MASSINASTTAGVVTTADTSGVLNIQTAGTTAVTVDASQNVTLAGTLTTTGVTTVQAGTAAAPAITTTGDTNTGIFFPAADTIGFSEGGAEAMRLDSAGNMGLGVTPSAWSNYKAIQMGSGVGLASYTAGAIILNLGTNQYYNGTNYVYVNTDFAASYQQTSGIHKWWTAPSGTAGNAITLTQAMTLNANGALALQGASTSANGVGITFPATQSASTNANTLDDYEEGTWTPTITRSSSNPTVTYTNQLGSYVKVGRLVNATFAVFWSANSGGSGNFTISGLPFPNTNSSDNYSQAFGVDMSGVTFAVSTTTLGGYVNINDTRVFLTCAGSAVASAGPTLGSTGYLFMSVTYMASA